MTVTLAPAITENVPRPAVRPAPGPLSARRTERTAREWAVIELRHDGTLGLPHLVLGTDPVDATLGLPTRVESLPARLPQLPPTLEAQLSRCHAAEGRLREAARLLTLGASATKPTAARTSCLGQLALVEAFLGDLRRATEHAGLVLSGQGVRRARDLDGVAEALLAHSWVSLRRGALVDARGCLDQASAITRLADEPWLLANRLLLEAELLMASQQPDAATRVLAGALEETSPLRRSAWLSGLLTTARADCLLVAGEPQRALAAVTPLPAGSAVEATVVAAEARREIGDVRGAQAVLQTVADGLELSPLAVQVRALLLESRLADDRHDLERAHLLLERALRVAEPEQMRAPLWRAWSWLRRVVDQDPALARAHADLLTGLESAPVGPGPAAPSSGPQGPRLVGALLTDRESQVLDLLAQMYSTDEIATALYVSANTVKTHLKGIFGKLCVNRRVDAVRRGRQLGLC